MKITLRDIFRLLRPKQWIKNLFVLAVVIFSGTLFQPTIFMRTIAATLLFCLMSSAVYLFNDIADVEQDRQHPIKRHRPLASKRVPISLAWILFIVFAILTLTGSWLFNWKLVLILGCYLVINVTYSLFLKQVPILDAFCISSGFILRVLAGGVASGVFISHWLLLCTITLSLFFAFGKRREEVASLGENSFNQRPSLEGYSLEFLDHAVSIMATLTIISYVLYVADPETSEFFGTRAVLLTAIFVLYGMFHYLSLVQTHQKGGNPSTLLLSDRHLQLSCFGWGLTWAIIIFLKFVVVETGGTISG